MPSIKEIVLSKDACSIPWLHTEISLQNQTVRPCCKYNGTIGDLKKEFSITWFDKPYQSLRQQFKQGTQPEQCSACNLPDDAFSYKNWKNKSYQLLSNKSADILELPHIFHITLTNACNLACRMCSPNQSSKLYSYARSTELKRFFQLSELDNSVNLEKLKGSFKNAMSVTLTGGEPLINESCYDLIQLIQTESANLREITFATNMTIFNSRLLDKLNQMSNVSIKLNVSIDGHEPINNYIRHGSDWNHIKANLCLIREKYPRFNIGVNSTISALNVGYLPELLLSLQELQQVADTKFVALLTSAVLDEHLHAGIIPAKIKDVYREKLSKFDMSQVNIVGAEQVIPTALELLDRDYEHHYDKFIDFITTFDKVAKTNFYSLYKEFGTA